jgi:hypothetical protein
MLRLMPLILLVITACGEPEGDLACCAIEPKAKCDAALHAMGVTTLEQAALRAAGPLCPSDALSATRIRQLDSQWPQACREAGFSAPMIDAGRC